MDLLMLPYLPRHNKVSSNDAHFCYSSEGILPRYYHPLHFEIELFQSLLYQKQSCYIGRRFKFAYSQAPAESAAKTEQDTR